VSSRFLLWACADGGPAAQNSKQANTFSLPPNPFSLTPSMLLCEAK
jgi:hypothetical protein